MLLLLFVILFLVLIDYFVLLIILFVLSGFIEVLGIASIAPFIALLTKPEMVVDNKFYNYAINYDNEQSLRSLLRC